MKTEITKLIAEHPKHYVNLIKRDPAMLAWVSDNTLIQETKLSAVIYSAVHQKTNICKQGNTQSFDRWSTGFIGCGPAATCACTRENIAAKVSATKQNYSAEQHIQINEQRQATMIEKYGTAYNSQRVELKHIWTKPKISADAHEKLTNREWLDTEYNTNTRTLTDIADELGVYYSTVAEYCKKFGFTIRQVTNYSLQEREISDFIASLGVQCVTNDWAVLETQEIDILIPSHNLGIEVDGLYWHSYHPTNKKIEDRVRHLDKSQRAAAKNIDILHITDYEWINKTDIIKNIIRSKLNLNQRIYARQCQILPVTRAEEKQFLNTHHLQGFVSSSAAYGLYYQNELTMLLTLGRSRFNKKATYEILRVCGLGGTTVTGGLSKLINHIRACYPNEQFITYCDLNKSTGNGYKQSGFSLVSQAGPGYFWTDGTSVISRYRCQKKQLAKWLKSFDPLLSESENMFGAGYRRFWDCGNLVFLG